MKSSASRWRTWWLPGRSCGRSSAVSGPGSSGGHDGGRGGTAPGRAASGPGAGAGSALKRTEGPPGDRTRCSPPAPGRQGLWDERFAPGLPVGSTADRALRPPLPSAPLSRAWPTNDPSGKPVPPAPASCDLGWSVQLRNPQNGPSPPRTPRRPRGLHLPGTRRGSRARAVVRAAATFPPRRRRGATQHGGPRILTELGSLWRPLSRRGRRNLPPNMSSIFVNVPSATRQFQATYKRDRGVSHGKGTRARPGARVAPSPHAAASPTLPSAALRAHRLVSVPSGGAPSASGRPPHRSHPFLGS